MKRTLASLAGLVGIAALGRWLAERRHARHAPAAPPAPAPAVGTPGNDAVDPAAELRRKLAEAREADAVAPAAEPVSPETLEERRARIHAKARAAIDAMSDEVAP